MENVYFVSSEDSGESNALISIEFKLYSAAVPAELMVSLNGEGVSAFASIIYCIGAIKHGSVNFQACWDCGRSMPQNGVRFSLGTLKFRNFDTFCGFCSVP